MAEGNRLEQERPAPFMTRVGLALVLIAALLGSVYGLLHVSVRTINPTQKAATGHFPWECGLCHEVDAKAPLVKVEK